MALQQQLTADHLGRPPDPQPDPLLVELIERHMLRRYLADDWHCAMAVACILRDGGWPGLWEALSARYSAPLAARVYGGPRLEETAAREACVLRWPEIDPARARPWDVGLVEAGGITAAAIFNGRWFAKSPAGYIILARRRARRAWRPA